MSCIYRGHIPKHLISHFFFVLKTFLNGVGSESCSFFVRKKGVPGLATTLVGSHSPRTALGAEPGLLVASLGFFH